MSYVTDRQQLSELADRVAQAIREATHVIVDWSADTRSGPPDGEFETQIPTGVQRISITLSASTKRGA